MKNSKVHLITFGGGSFSFRRSARRITLQAEASGLFKSITKVTDKTLPGYCSLAWGQHREFIQNSDRGFGFWIWKPMIIQKKLTEIPVGDTLIYLDAGCELNLFQAAPRERMREYIQLCMDHGSLAMQLRDIVGTGISPSERRYSKRSLILKLEPSEEIIAKNQLLATVIFMQNDDSNHSFLKQWSAVSTSDNYLHLTDELDRTEDLDFIAHRHDQSIFSILYKQQGRFFIPDETYWKPDWRTDGAPYPIWAMRNRTGVSQGEMKIPDLIDRAIHWLERSKRILTQK